MFHSGICSTVANQISPFQMQPLLAPRLPHFIQVLAGQNHLKPTPELQQRCKYCSCHQLICNWPAVAPIHSFVPHPPCCVLLAAPHATSPNYAYRPVSPNFRRAAIVAAGACACACVHCHADVDKRFCYITQEKSSGKHWCVPLMRSRSKRSPR